MHLEAELMIDSCLWTCFIWYLFATAGYHLDTLLDTLEEGRHSFLDFSTFPDLLKSSNPPLSAIVTVEVSSFSGFFIFIKGQDRGSFENFSFGKRQRRQSLVPLRANVSESVPDGYI
jgi:hypothetical protein